jgi:hypothetical protein
MNENEIVLSESSHPYPMLYSPDLFSLPKPSLKDDVPQTLISQQAFNLKTTTLPHLIPWNPHTFHFLLRTQLAIPLLKPQS